MATRTTRSFHQRPLASPDQLAAETLFVNLALAAERLFAGVEELVRAHGLTGAQYNALRVLRDAGPCGMSCQQLGASLITRDPDITRMADRLEENGLLEKRRSERDRRVVLLSLTDQGLDAVNGLDEPMLALHQRQMEGFDPAELEQLTRMLKRLGNSCSPLCCGPTGVESPLQTDLSLPAANSNSLAG